jgi:Raf kinase inhibitor-like YbhB/YbcL family protein
MFRVPWAWRLDCSLFQSGADIVMKITKKGGNISPPLEWTGVPDQTISLVLIVDDPDAPKGLFTHWIVYGLKKDPAGLAEHQPATAELPNGARQGLNGFAEQAMADRSRRRERIATFSIFDTETDIPGGLTRQEMDGVIEGHVIEEATLMGRYTNREKTRAA